MNTPQQTPAATRPATPRTPTPSLLFAEQFDDAELERALRAVSWNARDLEQFLRSNRAQ